MADLSLDSRRAAKATETQANNINNAMAMGINAAKPFLMFQTTMIRAFSDNLALIADNVEKGLTALDSQQQ